MTAVCGSNAVNLDGSNVVGNDDEDDVVTDFVYEDDQVTQADL